MLQQLAQFLSNHSQQKWSFAKCILCFSGVMFLAIVLVVIVVTRMFPDWEFLPGIVAGGVCWLAGCLALGLISLSSEPIQRANLSLLGMIIRMGLPIGSLLLVQKKMPSWSESGYSGQLVFLFLVMLVVEVWLSLRVA